jgi:hypothetical protein
VNITAIREKIHNYLEVADDRKIAAIYTMVEDAIEGQEVSFEEGFVNELDGQFAAYYSGTAPTVTAVESQQRMANLLDTK